tara:strand:+ start:79 stop:483 length:405 start_codon:yes stop_codon:yes gene_type:complete
MRSIILTTLFLIPLFGFASFPVNKTTLSDTIKSSTLILNGTTIKIKKETIENNIKFQNSNNNDKDFFTELAFLIGGIIFFLIGNLNYNNSKSFYGIFLMITGGISFVLGLLILLIKLITRSIERMKNKEKKLKR